MGTALMNGRWNIRVWLVAGCLLAVIGYPLIPGLENQLFQWLGRSLGSELTNLFIFALVALGLNVIVGYTGQLHLGIAAFFGIGAYITGIVTVAAFPFQWGFTAAVILSALGAAAWGAIMGAPTLRLRGDYVAIVTLGFGEVVRFTLRNLEEITNGTRGLNPVPPPPLPAPLATVVSWLGIVPDWSRDYRLFYYLALAFVLFAIVLLRNLERSRLGRAWIAVREDDLAASCMGINTARVKLSAFALGSALAGVGGCLYATNLTSTASPDYFDFNRSIIMLCCIILGGLGSLRGTLLGVLLIFGFDNVISPVLDHMIQQANINPTGNPLLVFNNWRLMIFGLALILMMRFRPDGLLPMRRV